MKRLYFEHSESTMEEAKWEWAREHVPLIVIAGSQAGGRGRLGRSWKSPKGGFYATLTQRAAKDRSQYLGLSLAVGVSIIEALSLPKRVSLKWPNDLMVDRNLKLGGILIEFLPNDGISIGIGINLNKVEVDGVKTSSLEELGINLSLDEIESKLCKCIPNCLAHFEQNSFTAFKEAWISRSNIVGEHVTLDDGVSGEVTDISDSGALILDGERVIISGSIL